MNIRVKKLTIIYCAYAICLSFGFGISGHSLYAQEDYLTVKGKTRADTVTFSGNRTAYPAAPLEGEVFYNSVDKALKYHNGTGWVSPGGGASGKSIATKVVAASNSLGSTCASGSCTNTGADYTCSGTNDQNVIAQALTDLGSMRGVIYLLEGTYNISGPINLNNTAPNDSNTSLIGSGNATILKLSGVAASIINASNVSGITISRLAIDGNNKAGAGSRGIYFNATTDSCINNIRVQNFSGEGIYLDAASNNNQITDCFLQGSIWNVYINNSVNNIVSGNFICGGLSGGVYLNSNANNNIVSDNEMPDSSGVQGVYIKSSANNVVTNNMIQNKAQGVWLNGYATPACENNIVSDNTIDSSGQYAMVVQTGKFNIIHGNNLSANYLGITLTDASMNNLIGSNIIAEEYYTGTGMGSLNLDYFCSQNFIIGNRIVSSVATTGNTYGIKINTSDSSNNYLVANFISGSHYTGAIYDYGNQTRYTDKCKITLDKRSFTTAGPAFTAPTSYLTMDANSDIGNLMIGNGYTPGAILVLEITQPWGGTLIQRSAGNTIFQFPGNPMWQMKQYDTITMMWNGSKWVEIFRALHGS